MNNGIKQPKNYRFIQNKLCTTRAAFKTCSNDCSIVSNFIVS